MDKNKSKKEMGPRDFLSTSALSTAGMVAGSMFLSPFASAQKRDKNNLTMKSENGQGPFPSKGMAAYTPDEWVTSHSCRRSFCTNEFLAGTPVDLIMKISGHKSLRDFYKYIRITPEEAGLKIREIWQNRGDMSIVKDASYG
jgi:integrase